LFSKFCVKGVCVCVCVCVNGHFAKLQTPIRGSVTQSLRDFSIETEVSTCHYTHPQEMQCTYKRNVEACSHNRCCRGKARIITYPESVFVALGLQHAMRMRRIILSSVTCMAVPYFSALLYKRRDFRKKLLNIKCVLIFSTTFVRKFLILRRTERDIIINVHRSSCKVPVILLRL
jgi:hypothetical protein